MKSRSNWIIVAIAAAVLVCICIVAAAVLGGAAYFGIRKLPTVVAQVTLQPQVQVTLVSPTQESPSGNNAAAPSPVPFPTSQAVTDAAVQTLNTLKDMIVPNADPVDLAERLKGVKNIPQTVPAPVKPYKVGDTLKFWANNDETRQNFQVDAVLSYVTDHSYFWIEKGVNYDKNDLATLATTFETKIYPTDREFFGSEWTPGVDNDVHLYIIYVRGLGQRIAGYFNSQDEYNPLAIPNSNAHEDFFLNADTVSLGQQDTYGTLAHEFQHMIHWYRDRNEQSWLNEGFSMLAEQLNGFDVGGFDQLYAAAPDLQLTDWPNDPNATAPHYGESFLFLTYFLDRFGAKATQAVVANTDNGLDSIDGVLKDLKVNDPQSGKPVQADDVFSDWVVTNYLNNSQVGDGRYAYKSYKQAPKFTDTEEINRCPIDWQNRTVNQYGVDYIHLTCQGKFTLNFEGTPEVGVLPANPHSGQYVFWSNKGDESDMTLTHAFDFTTTTGPIEMDYSTWYDVEKDYDYVYLVASLDGKSWEMIKTPTCNSQNPSGNNYGCGYTGVSNGWIQEKVDLSKFAGKKVQIRFEYITDAAVNGEGLMLDDVSVPAVGYKTDFETDDGGWTAAGFVRIQNKLPQTYRLELIREGSKTTVDTLTLSADQKISLPLDFGTDLQDAILVVSGSTRFTRQEAVYRFELQP